VIIHQIILNSFRAFFAQHFIFLLAAVGEAKPLISMMAFQARAACATWSEPVWLPVKTQSWQLEIHGRGVCTEYSSAATRSCC